MTNFESVEKFMRTFNHEIKKKLVFQVIKHLLDMTYKRRARRTKQALDNRDIKEVADALTDILYVTYGVGHAFGINLDKCFICNQI